jgi:hypothetical protein
LRPDDILRLIRGLKDDEPLETNISAGKATVVRIQARIGEMSEADIFRLLEQIEERAHWGKMQVVKRAGILNVTWERTVQK